MGDVAHRRDFVLVEICETLILCTHHCRCVAKKLPNEKASPYQSTLFLSFFCDSKVPLSPLGPKIEVFSGFQENTCHLLWQDILYPKHDTHTTHLSASFYCVTSTIEQLMLLWQGDICPSQGNCWSQFTFQPLVCVQQILADEIEREGRLLMTVASTLAQLQLPKISISFRIP